MIMNFMKMENSLNNFKLDKEMKNNTYIVLLPIENRSNSRTQLEKFENESFQTIKDAKSFLVDFACKDFLLMQISDFMEECNNEDFNPNYYWLGYITILE